MGANVYGVPATLANFSSLSGARPTAIELFCGAGGMSLGFERAGFDVLTAVDIDPVHLAVHEFNFPLTYAECADASRIDGAMLLAAAEKGWSLRNRSTPMPRRIDCIFGGPSCQGFSEMGNQKADDPRNDLIHRFADLVLQVNPRSFVMENVPGLLYPRVRAQFDRLLAVFRDGGYTVCTNWPQILDASDYGVPQRRRRVFLVGHDKDVAPPHMPTVLDRESVASALAGLPLDRLALPSGDGLRRLSAIERSEIENCGSAYALSLRDRQNLEYVRVWDRNVLSGMSATAHSPEVIHRMNQVEPGRPYAAGRTVRLHPDLPAPTLRAGTGRDHGSFTAPRPIHHIDNRVITVREAARLHSFPDWFQFHRTKWHGLRQIGNAVPPQLAAAVAGPLVSALGFAPAMPVEQMPAGDQSLLSITTLGAADYFGYDRSELPADVRRFKRE